MCINRTLSVGHIHPYTWQTASPNNKYDPKDRTTEFLTDASKVENLTHCNIGVIIRLASVESLVKLATPGNMHYDKVAVE